MLGLFQPLSQLRAVHWLPNAYAIAKQRAQSRCLTFQPWASLYRATFWHMGAPKNTPAEIIDRLNKEINAALADPEFKARLTHLDGTALGGSPADFGKLIADETEKWSKVVKFSGAKPD